MLKYRPEVDGLRALAVIPVILFHMEMEWIPGGYVGVDVFFTISGFLITKVILSNIEANTFSFSNFWLRRFNRIIPALLIMVLVTTIAGYFILYKPDRTMLGKHGMASLLSVSNIYYWMLSGNYWGNDEATYPFLHTWSLSVEMQFYFIWPILLFFLLRLTKGKMIACMIGMLYLSIMAVIAGTMLDPIATFYFLPTRAWELLSGCLLAILFYHYSPQIKKIQTAMGAQLSLCGLLLIILSYLFLPWEEGMPLNLVAPVMGTVLLLAFADNPKTLSHRLLTIPAVIFIGKISYSLYLWHWPVLLLAKNMYVNANPVVSPLNAVIILFAVSVFSYFVIEQKTRYGHKLYAPLLGVFLCTFIMSSILGNSIYKEDTTRFNQMVWKGQLYSVAPRVLWPKGWVGDGVIECDENANGAAFAEGGVQRLHGGGPPEVVVLGDSHALMWGRVLDEIFEELGLSASFYGANGTTAFMAIPVKPQTFTSPFNTREKFVFDTMRLKFIEEWRPKLVIISDRWAIRHDYEKAQDFMRWLKSRGLNVLLIGQPPQLFFGDRNASQYLVHMNISPQKNVDKYIPIDFSQGNEIGKAVVKKLASTWDHCYTVDVADLYTKDGNALVLKDFDLLYLDDDHLSYEGTLLAKPRLKEAIQRLLTHG